MLETGEKKQHAFSYECTLDAMAIIKYIVLHLFTFTSTVERLYLLLTVNANARNVHTTDRKPTFRSWLVSGSSRKNNRLSNTVLERVLNVRQNIGRHTAHIATDRRIRLFHENSANFSIR